MVHLCGGPAMIGLTGLLERMYHRFLKALDFSDEEVDIMCTKALSSPRRPAVAVF